MLTICTLDGPGTILEVLGTLNNFWPRGDKVARFFVRIVSSLIRSNSMCRSFASIVFDFRRCHHNCSWRLS